MIYVSVGHHADKPGACHEGLCEYQLAARWVFHIVNELGDRGYHVPDGVLREKVQYINERRPLLAAEIHFNSDPARAGKGCETLYYPGSTTGWHAAERVQAAMAAVIQPSRGVKEGYYRMKKEYGPDFFLAKTSCVALIIEPEFIHQTESLYRHEAAACKAIAQGLLQAEEYIRSMQHAK